MLNPISYISELYVGPCAVDVTTAVEAYADKLAGRRRRMDISMTSLSVATLRDVDDAVRDLTKASRAWLVEGAAAEAKALRHASAMQNGEKEAKKGENEAEDAAPAEDSDDDDDNLIIAANSAPKTGIVRRKNAISSTNGCAHHQKYFSFIDLLSKAKSVKGPSLPPWEDMIVAAGEEAVERAVREKKEKAVENDNKNNAPNQPPSSSCPDNSTAEKKIIEFQWSTIDLSNPLDQQLFTDLEAERFDEKGVPLTVVHVSGRPMVSEEDACPWARGAFTAEVPLPASDANGSVAHQGSEPEKAEGALVARPSPPLSVRVLFPNLTSLDLSYTRISSMDAFADCKSLQEIRIVNNLGIRAIPKGMDNLVGFEADRCFALEDISSGLSGLQKLKFISIDECYKIKRLPRRLPSLTQFNISRTDGIIDEDDCDGVTFADPLNYPNLEELFMHGQKTIKHLYPPPPLSPPDAEDDSPETVAPPAVPDTATTTQGLPLPILPKLQVLVASASVVEGLEVPLSGHATLNALTMGPLCAAVPSGLVSIRKVDVTDCVKLDSLAPLIKSLTLEELNISGTDSLEELIEGAGEEEYESEDDEEEEGGGGADKFSKLSLGVETSTKQEEKEELAQDAKLEIGPSRDANEGGAVKKDKKSASQSLETDSLKDGEENEEEDEENEEEEEDEEDVEAQYPIFPGLATFIANGASIKSLQPLRGASVLEEVDISYTKNIKTIPQGWCSLKTLNANYSGLRSMDAMEGSLTLTTLYISFADSLKVLPQLPAIEQINDHKANFFLKMYVVSNLQQRGMRMMLKHYRDEERNPLTYFFEHHSEEQKEEDSAQKRHVDPTVSSV